VELFARRGDAVYFLYEKNHEAAASVAQKTGATAICCDVADGEAVKAAFAKIPDVDILVCNAGICHTGLMSMITEAQWDREFAVNVKGMYHCINAAMPSFLKKQAGAVVTVSSMWGQVGASCEAVYSATKGAVIALTKALAKELGPSGIRVNCVAPGVICTDMCANVDPEIMAQMAEEAPVGRNGTPEDVAKAILYLSGADFVTGQVLPVNGGFVI
jgi:3-oxoacyl-[acyl-carrier protein] reductase